MSKEKEAPIHYYHWSEDDVTNLDLRKTYGTTSPQVKPPSPRRVDHHNTILSLNAGLMTKQTPPVRITHHQWLCYA
jgi:hypothetical protein